MPQEIHTGAVGGKPEQKPTLEKTNRYRSAAVVHEVRVSVHTTRQRKPLV